MIQSEEYINAVVFIKEAILRSRSKVIAVANRELLSLYYGIGRFVSGNSRNGFWGTGAIEQISVMLQKELPGLRGFSATNMKRMRTFYEEWYSALNADFAQQQMQKNQQSDSSLPAANCPPLADDLGVNENLLLAQIRPPVAGEYSLLYSKLSLESRV